MFDARRTWALVLVSLLSTAAAQTTQQCEAVKSDVASLKSIVTSPVFFCNFWLGKDRASSPFPAYSVPTLNRSCQCILKAAGSPAPAIKKSTVSGSVRQACVQSLAPRITSEFARAKNMCSFYNSVNRDDTPVRGLTPVQVQRGCVCILNAASATSSRITTRASTSSLRPATSVTKSSMMSSMMSSVITSASSSVVSRTTASTTSAIPTPDTDSCSVNSYSYSAANGKAFGTTCDHINGFTQSDIINILSLTFRRCLEACSTLSTCVAISYYRPGTNCVLLKSVEDSSSRDIPDWDAGNLGIFRTTTTTMPTTTSTIDPSPSSTLTATTSPDSTVTDAATTPGATDGSSPASMEPQTTSTTAAAPDSS